MLDHIDPQEFGDAAAVCARHRALVLIDEALAVTPRFAWQAGLASWDGEDGGHYRGRFGGGSAVLWGAHPQPDEADRLGPAVTRELRIDTADDVSPPTFCLRWHDGAWSSTTQQPGAAVTVIGPLLSDSAAAEWADWQHGRPDLVDPLHDFLDVVAVGIPMTPHALAAFTDDVEELNTLMRRAAELGLGIGPGL